MWSILHLWKDFFVRPHRLRKSRKIASSKDVFVPIRSGSKPWDLAGWIRPYFVGIFRPYIGLFFRVGTSNLGPWNPHWDLKVNNAGGHGTIHWVCRDQPPEISWTGSHQEGHGTRRATTWTSCTQQPQPQPQPSSSCWLMDSFFSASPTILVLNLIFSWLGEIHIVRNQNGVYLKMAIHRK